jgi:HEAT repeat protein
MWFGRKTNMRPDDLRIVRQCAMLAATLLVLASVTWGHPIKLPVSLEELTAEADIIFKGLVVSSRPVQSKWFTPGSGLIAQETQFTVISVIKGDPAGAMVRFHHYDEIPQFRGQMRQMWRYHFQIDRTYIVFAKKTEDADIHRQLWVNDLGKENQGVFLCSDNKPVMANTVKEALWKELTMMLHSADIGSVSYAIRQLDRMSGGRDRFDGTQDFDRTNVVRVVHDLMTHSDSKIAHAAIAVVGSHNPYLSDERTNFWLASVGSAEVPGFYQMDPKMRNIGGELYWKDLESIATTRHPAETRALAIRALGLVREPALRQAIDRWLVDTEAMVRASATVLLADYPGPATDQQLTVLAGDNAPVVRACVARAIGFSQRNELANLLDRLLADKDAEVRRVASICLLSFSPRDEAVARVFRANLENAEFQPLFLNALARENPEPYLAALAKVVEEKAHPANWMGGQIPAFTAWEILFGYLRAQPSKTLHSGKLDRYLDALEKVGNYSSSEPRDIYAFYILSGMTDRVKKFRERATKAASYDLDYYFKQVDQNPSLYRRQ